MILDHERDLAKRLACKVLDKPKPPLWMIFLPVFFIFFVQKMTQYKKGLADFTDNHLKARLRAMDKAIGFLEQQIKTIKPHHLDDLAPLVPEKSREYYVRWMMVMIEHYMQLLDTPGETMKTLVRNGYQNKTNYLLLCNCLNTAEKAYTKALLLDLEGDEHDLKLVVEKLNVWIEELRRQDANAFFS
ncbi:MAG: hypothetical protein GX043_07780 [Desulfovibrionales bacterium]|nr:hypothetical protein [Desulfovibrionales bacterium]